MKEREVYIISAHLLEVLERHGVWRARVKFSDDVPFEFTLGPDAPRGDEIELRIRLPLRRPQ